MEQENTQPADWVISIPRMHLLHVVCVHSEQREEQRTATTTTSVSASVDVDENKRMLLREMLVVRRVLVSYCSWEAVAQIELTELVLVYVVAFWLFSLTEYAAGASTMYNFHDMLRVEAAKLSSFSCKLVPW